MLRYSLLLSTVDQVVVVFTDGSERRGVKSGWAYSVRQNGVFVTEGSGAFVQTISSMCMEVRAISEAITWLRDERNVHYIFVTYWKPA